MPRFSGPLQLVQQAAPSQVSGRTQIYAKTDGKVYAKDAGGVEYDLTSSGFSGAPASSVVSETTFGQSSTVGVSDDYARADHSHGTPPDPAADPDIYVQAAQPTGAAPYLWVQTGLGPSGEDFTFWIEDGA